MVAWVRGGGVGLGEGQGGWEQKGAACLKIQKKNLGGGGLGRGGGGGWVAGGQGCCE